jgi:hypothetical protein
LRSPGCRHKWAPGPVSLYRTNRICRMAVPFKSMTQMPAVDLAHAGRPGFHPCIFSDGGLEKARVGSAMASLTRTA